MDQLKTAIREKGIAVEELRQYSYDTNRNQTDIKNTKTGEDQTYVYDAENRLSQVSVTKDGKTAVIQQNIYNGEGQRIQKIDGETMIQGYDQAKNEICYAGGIYDQSTGLYYLNARYYNPEDGRFLTEDTYHGENDNLIRNIYTCIAVNYVDPSGHYAVALYTLVKIVAGGVVFYVSYSTWKRRRIKTRYATRILNEKYGKGNWGKGPGSEYSRIIKYHRK